MTPQPPQERLEGVRVLARALQDSADTWVWQVAQAIDQLCMGTITVAQAMAQVED